jgi:hypothetical protein
MVEAREFRRPLAPKQAFVTLASKAAHASPLDAFAGLLKAMNATLMALTTVRFIILVLLLFLMVVCIVLSDA